MPSLTWYINRLGRMSAAELAYRITQASRSTADRFAHRAQLNPPAPHAASASCVFAPGAADLDPASYIAAAERVIAGRFSFFDLQDCELGATPDWNRDPLTGRSAPLMHAGSLDYRDESLVGNIKYLWEPNRHLHVPRLAQAYALTSDVRYALALKSHIESWIEQCPCGRGPNWSSSLELAIRLINWSLAWQWIGGMQSPLFAEPEGRHFRDRWLRSVYQQTRAITRKLSRFSSANNHLIGEAAGVWIASVTWNGWPDMHGWGLRCRQILIDETFTQNAADGGNREQAFSYQQFVLDFLLLAGLAARAADHEFPDEYWARIQRMLEFIASVMDVAGRVPMIGDADDGYVVSLSPDPQFNNFRSLLATGAVLFERDDFAAKAGPIDDKTRWLLGAEASARYERASARAVKYEPQRAFPQSGYYTLGNRLETRDEVRMLVDAGPLGYLSIAAHGHADALSIVLSVGGCEVLVDPGTYAYHTEPQWRSYFRSTRAHNTVVVDGQDQSRQAGSFMWSRHANARCIEFQADGPQQRFVGEHDGYRWLSDPVMHRREITYDASARRFTIVDAFACREAHDIERRWHFAESLEPTVDGGAIEVRAGRYRVRLVPVDAPDSIDRFHGGGPGQGGWVSRSFGCKRPATTIAWRSRLQSEGRVTTYIYVEEVTSD